MVTFRVGWMNQNEAAPTAPARLSEFLLSRSDPRLSPPFVLTLPVEITAFPSPDLQKHPPIPASCGGDPARAPHVPEGTSRRCHPDCPHEGESGRSLSRQRGTLQRTQRRMWSRSPERAVRPPRPWSPAAGPGGASPRPGANPGSPGRVQCLVPGTRRGSEERCVAPGLVLKPLVAPGTSVGARKEQEEHSQHPLGKPPKAPGRLPSQQS